MMDSRALEELIRNIARLNQVMEETLSENRLLRREVACLHEEVERSNRLRKEVR